LIEPSSKTEEASLPKAEPSKRKRSSSKEMTQDLKEEEIISYKTILLASKKEHEFYLITS
jgi:hypothetical protein